MSDSEGDFSDELLELAGATEKKRRKRQAESKTVKRRRAEHSDPESEDAESESEDENSNPYPLEGKYIDEADRERLLDLPEIEREDILAQRQDKLQRIQDKRNLDEMLSLRDKSGVGDDAVSKVAKRQHAQRGATKEKSKKLDELKARRKAKDEKKRTRGDSPKRDRSSSPMDMETSEDEEEDGQINKFEDYNERNRRSPSKAVLDDEPVQYEGLRKICLSRDLLAKQYMTPWFEELVKGAWVRYCIGAEDGRSIYRACEIIEVSPKLVTPYKVNEQLANQELVLRHGNSEKSFTMDKVSNSPFSDKEFTRIVRVYEADKLKLPSKRQAEKKAAHIAKLSAQALTEADISAMLARRNQMGKKQNAMAVTMEKSRLNQARTLALRRNDLVEVAQIDAQLAALTGDSTPARLQSSQPDELARLNERNRKANRETARKAEMLEAERKRSSRKLAMQANGTATPPLDRIKQLKSGDSRPGTPVTPATPIFNTDAGTPGSESPARPPSAKPLDPAVSFEAAVLDSVDIDLGDF